jgi:ribosome-binding protein aMBF1 (putative translation factor)
MSKVYREVARFPSSSSGKVYTVKEDQDGNLSCDCPAWRFKKPNQERSCKHTEAVASGKTPPAVPTSQPVDVRPTDEVVEGLMADIEKARAARAWKPLGQALEELDKDKTEGG